MKFTMTKIAAGLVLAAAATGAQAVSVSSLTLSGASFCMDSPGSANTVCQNTGTGGNVGNAIVTGVDSSYNLVGGYVGAGTFSGGANPASIIDMTFFGGAVNTYTAATNHGTVNAPAGTIAGGPVPTANITGSLITVDLSSWFANYNGTDFNQGSPSASGTYNVLTNAFDIKWTATIQGGSFNQFVGTWTLQGTAIPTATAPIPEASTYGMMLAGLGLVGGMVARRRKLMA